MIIELHLKIILFLALLVGCFVLAALNSSFLSIKVFLIVVLGLLYVHGVELLHEVLHMKKNLLNRIIGFFLGLPLLVSYSDYRFNHIIHHAKLGTPEDSEFFTYDKYDNNLQFIVALFMPSHFLSIFKKIWLAITGSKMVNKIRYSKNTEMSVRLEYILFCAILSVFLSFSIYTGSLLLLELWLIPVLLISLPLHVLLELPEHYGCDRSSKDVFRNTRTLKSNSLMSWFVNGNNYHVEHHLRPSLPNLSQPPNPLSPTQ